MKYCPVCKQEYPDDSGFCGICGVKLEPVAPKAPEPVVLKKRTGSAAARHRAAHLSTLRKSLTGECSILPRVRCADGTVGACWTFRCT